MDAGISTRRILLGGFSQGGAIALFTGLSAPFKLAGILALSTWLPLSKSIPWENAQKQKVLQCHGVEDNMVSIQRAHKTGDLLKKHLKSNMSFKEYPGLEHTISSRDEQLDILKFLEDSLPSVDSKL